MVNVGYPNRPEFICQFHSVRYHLSEYDTDRLLANATKNFNYRHSQLRSVIEYTFGVVKHRFAILRGYMPFPFETQAKIVLACFLLHNFICKADREDLLEDLEDELEETWEANLPEVTQELDEEEEIYNAIGLTQQQKKEKVDQMRENIMHSMWHG